MELAVRSRRSIRKQCKLSDYVTTTLAANMSYQTIPSMEETIVGQGDAKGEREPPKTPSTPKNKNVETKTTLTNPLMTRIQRDLNSPSANVRLRALKAIRSPTKSAYGQFDVSHTEKSIITVEERERATKKSPTLREILKDIVVYVEVRTDDDDRSAGVRKVIAALGARVNDTLKRDTTHVIFKDGRPSTFRKAKSLGIPIVSILWIEACKNQRRICNPKDFQISNLDRYENPELYGKMKRYKFIQPGAEDKKRRPKKQTIEPTPPKGNNSQTDIGRFFKAIEKTASKINKNDVTPMRLKTNSVVDSPATTLLNRMNSDNYTPIASVKKAKSAVKNVVETTPVTIQRRSSLDSTIADTTHSIAQMSLHQITPQCNSSHTASKVNSKYRRRTMLPIANSTRLSDLNETVKEKAVSSSSSSPSPSQRYELLLSEEFVIENKKSSDKFSVASTVRRQTAISNETMEISNMQQKDNGKATPEQNNKAPPQPPRRTLYTPQTIIECSRKRIDDENLSKTPTSSTTMTAPTEKPLNDETIVDAVPMSIITTPVSNALEEEENINEAAAPIASARHLCRRRRTLFDVSMDIISHQVQHINAKSRQSLLPTTKTPVAALAVASTTATSTDQQESQNIKSNNKEIANECNNTPTVERPKEIQMIDAACNTIEKKKRKLFRPLDYSPFATPPPSTPSKTSRESSSINSITPKISTKRRRTLLPVKTSDSNFINTEIVDAAPSLKYAILTKKTSSKDSLLSRRSTMDFEPPRPAHNQSKFINPLPETISDATLKENNVNTQNALNADQNMTTSKPIAQPKRRLPFLAFTNMRSEQVAMINEAVKKFGGFIVERTVCPHTTHMVSFEARRTMNLLRGLVRGLWILDYNWILDSLKAGHWLKEELYEMKDFSRAVEICRAERQAFGHNYKCELFTDLGAFFISSHCDNIPARDLKELICLCGGTVVDQRKNAKYILSSSTRAFDDKIYVTPLWILDSITKMQLLRIQKYSAVTQLPTKHTPSNTRNMPTAVDLKE